MGIVPSLFSGYQGRGNTDLQGRGEYTYLEDLLSLESREPTKPVVVPPLLAAVHTQLQVTNWARSLQGHPDRVFVAYLLRGFTRGVRIGFDDTAIHLKPAKSNMTTARDHPEVITKYLAEESEKGRVIDPLDPDQATHVRQISRFGVIPKGHTPDKWRLIVDLSAPAGSSINDGIEKS